MSDPSITEALASDADELAQCTQWFPEQRIDGSPTGELAREKRVDAQFDTF